MLFLHTSNRYEILRELLLAELADAPPDPFVMQEIIVPNSAIQSDLERALARRQGVAAGVLFSFPGRWLWQQITTLLPEVAKDSPFAPERSTWRIMRLIADPAFTTDAPLLASWLADADPLLRYELAGKIAALFSAYAIYRPDYLTTWQAGETLNTKLPHESWQARLWEKLAKELGLGKEHPALIFCAALGSNPDKAAQKLHLPPALSVFCLHELPALHLEMLNRIAGLIDVHLYLLNPCREYWTDLPSSKNMARLEALGRADFLDQGHPLLADWGRQTQTLATMLLENEAIVGRELFHPGEGDSLLIRLQNSILENAPPAKATWPLVDNDRSVEIHLAHSLFRQLEILRDQLLARLKLDPSLGLADIVVLLPDLDAAAPLIEAVFSRETPRLPYSITGYNSARNPAARLILALMKLAAPGAVLPASEVFAFCREFAPLLGLSAAEAETLSAALKEAGAHWGMEKGKDAPLGAKHTWRDALARLFLGYALPNPGGEDSADIEPFQGILPAANLAGSRARILGAAWLFLERLEKLQKAILTPLLSANWRELWLKTLAEWLDDGKNMSALADAPETADAAFSQTLAAINALCDNMAAAEAEPIASEVAVAALEQALQTEAFAAKPSGALTFAELSALRSLPYRMVCVLGLEDGAFPHREDASEFDLMPLLPRPGDRRQNHAERNLFLDAILSARESLYLSYSGRSQRDDSEMPPSLLLAQLRDFLLEATGAPSSRLQVVHPLQAFSPEYFSGDSRLVSFREDYAEALQNAAATSKAPPFFPAPIPAADKKEIALPELQAFFQHPARALLRDRLGIRLPDVADEIEDIEPQTADALPRYSLNQRLLAAALAGADEARLFRLGVSGVEYPGGRFGEVLLATETKAVAAYAKRLLPHLHTRETREISLAMPQHLLFASLSNLTPDGLIAFRYARAKGRDYISTWLAHLFLNASGRMLPSRFFARDQDFAFAPLAKEAAASYLADWLAAWEAGWQKPLAFYPESAWGWQRKGESEGRKIWVGSDYSPPEADAWWRLALGEDGVESAINDDFAQWRERLLSPLCLSLNTLPEQA